MAFSVASGRRIGMKEGKRVRVSQCMIVRNEEKNIERALSWGKSVMWEQIVVDTGSTDRTVEIAEPVSYTHLTLPTTSQV